LHFVIPAKPESMGAHIHNEYKAFVMDPGLRRGDG